MGEGGTSGSGTGIGTGIGTGGDLISPENEDSSCKMNQWFLPLKSFQKKKCLCLFVIKNMKQTFFLVEIVFAIHFGLLIL